LNHEKSWHRYRPARFSETSLLTLDDLNAARRIVHHAMQATPQYRWPLLAEATGCDLWLKHENHTPTGAFKVRGGLVYMDWLKRTHPEVKGVVTATRGNHGQSVARAASLHGLKSKILVPFGNSREKNAAMRAFGGDVIEHGRDFDEAKLKAGSIAEDEGFWAMPSFDMQLVAGVASYALELFGAEGDLDTVYVPIGLGSGICGLISARDALGLKTRIVGVVSSEANAYAQSFSTGRIVTTETANTFADGMAVRVPDPTAFEIIKSGAERVIEVSDDEVADAVRLIYRTTHNLAEGAGAAALAGLMQERRDMRGKKVACILCGCNIDQGVFSTILQGTTPRSAAG
jgi:threonine dehydratase